MHLKLKPYKQSKGMCGPTSLRIVLNYYGIKKSEEELKKLLKVQKYLYDVSIKLMLGAAKKLGFKAKYKTNSSIKEIRRLIKKKIPVIIGWYAPSRGSHYSVVEGIDKQNIYIADPELGKIVPLKIKEFEKWWQDIHWAKLSNLRKLLMHGRMFLHHRKEKYLKREHKMPIKNKSKLVKREIIIIRK